MLRFLNLADTVYHFFVFSNLVQGVFQIRDDDIWNAVRSESML
ncbi:Uncharacterised protein [Legionella pneumophila]|nr:Uncharacterised protein [Legionella pneumophila]